MGERKVLNRYIPPDFDATLIPKIKRDYNKLTEIRMMLPFSMRCNTCGEYQYRGKKFNSKKEVIQDTDDMYMGIRKHRFYIKCSVCSAEIVFKTDPKNADYECESGASRNFEVWRDNTEAQEAADKEREEEDDSDAMKALENRTIDSKHEMDLLDALDEMKAINQRLERVDTEAVINKLTALNQKTVLVNGLTEADEQLVQSTRFRNSKKMISTLSDSDDDELLTLKSSLSTTTQDSLVRKIQEQAAKEQSLKSQGLGQITIKKKKRKNETDKSQVESKEEKKQKKTTTDSEKPISYKAPTSVSAGTNQVSTQSNGNTLNYEKKPSLLGSLLTSYGSESDEEIGF